jgi:hypothetical protein
MNHDMVEVESEKEFISGFGNIFRYEEIPEEYDYGVEVYLPNESGELEWVHTCVYKGKPTEKDREELIKGLKTDPEFHCIHMPSEKYIFNEIRRNG